MTIGKAMRIAMRVMVIATSLGALGCYLQACGKAASAPASVALNTDNIISNYKWYHGTYRKCLAHDQQVATALEALKLHNESMDTTSFVDKQERNRLTMVVLGLRDERATLVKQYSSNSARLAREKFKGWSLPHSLTVMGDRTIEVME